MMFTAEFYRLVRHEFVRNAIVIVIALTVFAWVLDATFPEDSVTESKHPLAGAQKPSKGLSAEPICYHLTEKIGDIRTPDRTGSTAVQGDSK
jgi:hypothetical protein